MGQPHLYWDKTQENLCVKILLILPYTYMSKSASSIMPRIEFAVCVTIKTADMKVKPTC